MFVLKKQLKAIDFGHGIRLTDLGRGKNINVLCKAFPDRLEINIKDTGKGFNVDNPPKPEKDDGHTHLGLGITFMKTLMDVLEISSRKGQGTNVKLIKNTSAAKAS